MVRSLRGMLGRYVVPRVGLEPTRCHHHRILNPARLPIPPPRPIDEYYSKL
jgi:hypothetical protein